MAFRFAGNLGLILGPASGDLVDVDLDCPEARAHADTFLPPTDAITGRPNSPRSHRWYLCPGVRTVRHSDPKTHASIVELRGQGSQTLVGPSLHPSGEPYETLDGSPAQIDLATLRQAVAALAAEVIRVRHGVLPMVQKTVSPMPRRPTSVGIDRPRLLRRAAAYLGAMPPAIAGQGGHKLTYAAATALVHGFGLTELEALQLLQQRYNPRCQPPWSERELLHKVTDAAHRPHARPYGWLLSQSALS